MTPIRLAAAIALLQAGGVPLRYGAGAGSGDRIFTEQRISIRVGGTGALTDLAFSLYPLLKMQKLLLRAEGTRTIEPGGRHRFAHDEARVEMRFEDKDLEYDFTRGMPPENDKDKLRQMMWVLGASGRSFTLSPAGEYGSEDATQDHHGEALDLIALGVTRMPPGPVKEGDSYEREWRGARSDREKKNVFAFRQEVRVEKIENRDGKKTAILSSTLAGTLEPLEKESRKPGESPRATVEGKTTLVLEVDGGRVVSSDGSGRVVSSFRGPAEGGAPSEVTITFECEGKLRAR